MQFEEIDDDDLEEGNFEDEDDEEDDDGSDDRDEDEESDEEVCLASITLWRLLTKSRKTARNPSRRLPNASRVRDSFDSFGLTLLQKQISCLARSKRRGRTNVPILNVCSSSY